MPQISFDELKKKFLEEQKNKAKRLPEKLIIDITKIKSIEEYERIFEDDEGNEKKVVRYIVELEEENGLTTKYEIPKSVMRDIILLNAKGFTKMEITKEGKGKFTKYFVIPAPE